MRVAIIGQGRSGRGIHGEYFLSDVNQKIEVVAIVDEIDVRREKGMKGFGCDGYADYRELFNRKDIDLIVNASFSHMHYSIAKDCLEHGYNVLNEKPFAKTVYECMDLIKTAEKNGVLVTAFHQSLYGPTVLKVKEVIESGKIGETVSIESRIHGSRGIPSDWRCHKPYGGGMMLDWGVHLIDQMLNLIPETVTRVYCEMTNITTDEVDDGFKLLLTFASGKRAFVEVGTYNFLALPRFYMQSRKGTAMIEDWRKNARVALCKAWHESDVVPVQTAAGITKTMAPRDSVTLDEFDWTRPSSDVHDYYRNLVLAIDGKAEIIVKLPEVRRVLAVMEAGFLSHETGNAVSVEI
jgi:predicted dehydrogenase